MRRTETVTISDRQVTFTEISVSKVARLFDKAESPAERLPGILAELQGLLPLALDVPLAELLDMDLYYDDLMALYEAFKRTNPAFFETARALNLEDALASVTKTLIGSFSGKLLTSLSTAMAAQSGTTATAAS